MDGTGDSTLRAKYLDWCSARLAERFLDLSPEEIYALARPDAGSGSDAPDPAESTRTEPTEPDDRPELVADPSDAPASPEADSPPTVASQLPHPAEESYRTLVQRVTEVLLRRTSLPTFEQWAEAYAETPERFDAELLGFWKDAVDSGFDDSSEDAAD